MPYSPSDRYYAVHSMGWIDIKLVSLTVHSIRPINFSSVTERHYALSHLQVLYRKNQLLFDERYPLDVVLISLNAEPFKSGFTDILYSLSIPNHHSFIDYLSYHDKFEKGINSVIHYLDPVNFLMNRVEFEDRFQLTWN